MAVNNYWDDNQERYPYYWDDRQSDPAQTAPTTTAPSGPPYTTANPPPAPPDGMEYILNPETGEFELKPRATATPPPTDPTTNEPPPPVYNAPTYTGVPSSTFDSSSFAWPTFNAPTYTPGPAFQAPPAFSYDPFSYDAFQAPEFNDIYKDGSFKGRRDEGLQAIEHGAAAKGLSRLPQTLKALSGWNQDFASREYGNIFDRSANTYDRNRGNAFGNWQANRNNAADAYSMNYGVSRDVWDRGEQQNLSAFDRNYTSARDMFDFNEFQPSKMTFDDLYRRWKAELDSNTSIATAGAGY